MRACPPASSRPLLIVDDDPDIREVLAEVLGEEGFCVHVARDGQDALEQVAAGLRPCLIFLDWMMPRLDGRGLLDALEARGLLSDLTVVVTTAFRSGVQDARATCVLPKPFDLGDLLELAERHCRAPGSSAR